MQGNNFELIDKGYNSEIFLYQNNMVLKMVDVKFTKQTKHLANEFQLMSTLDHPNILKVVNFKRNIPIKGISDPTSNCKRDVLIMEFANGGSLLSVVKTGLENDIKKTILIQLVDAFLYLHQSKGIAHRDIKLDNILARKNLNGVIEVLISDFGFAIQNTNILGNKVDQGKEKQEVVVKKSPRSKSLGKNSKVVVEKSDLPKQNKPFLVNSYKGTKRAYMAPQLHKLSENLKVQSYDPFKADVFSFGVVLFCLFFQKLPFEFSTKLDPIYGYIQRGKWQQFWTKHKLNEQKYSNINLEELKTLLERMLQQCPDKRIVMRDVYESAFMKEIRAESSIFKSKKSSNNVLSKQR